MLAKLVRLRSGDEVSVPRNGETGQRTRQPKIGFLMAAVAASGQIREGT